MSSDTPFVLVTGAASGVGLASAELFAMKGWKVAIADKNYEAAKSVAADNPAFLPLDLDVGNAVSVADAFAYAFSQSGRFDALVNNAGIQKWVSLHAFDSKAWQSVIDVNLTGVAQCLAAAVPFLIQSGGGAIVNISSISASGGVPLRAPYSASKAGVEALTATAAVELAENGIRVNAVAPGYVATALMDRYIANKQIDIDPILAQTPMRRMADPAEIAEAVYFLASSASSFVTGQTLTVDGGMSANSGVPAGKIIER